CAASAAVLRPLYGTIAYFKGGPLSRGQTTGLSSTVRRPWLSGRRIPCADPGAHDPRSRWLRSRSPSTRLLPCVLRLSSRAGRRRCSGRCRRRGGRPHSSRAAPPDSPSPFWHLFHNMGHMLLSDATAVRTAVRWISFALSASDHLIACH